MDKSNKKLSVAAKKLDKKLFKYRNCLEAITALEERRELIKSTFSYIPTITLDGMPKGSNKGDGAARLTMRLDEVDTKIKLQLDKATQMLIEIMDIISLLPELTDERLIFELKYLDGYNHDEIADRIHMSRSSINRKWKKGLYQLLERKKVKKAL